MQIEYRTLQEHKRKFIEFLGSDDHEGKYLERIRNTMSEFSNSFENGNRTNNHKKRFLVNINELRSLESDFARNLINKPREYIVALQEAVTESAKTLDPSNEKLLKTNDIQVGFEGTLGHHSVTPRGLSSTFLNKLVEVEGIITKCGNVKPKLMRAVQFCPKTKLYTHRDFRDNTSMDIGMEVKENGEERLPTSSALPKTDATDNELELEYGFCKYKDCQSFVLQEMPEKARVGQLPRSVEVMLEHDLVDRAKPGDRVLCIGVYRSLPGQLNGQSNTSFKTVLICNNISIIGKEVGAVRLTGADVANIRNVSSTPNILDILSRSLCPSIFGHEFIKKALILQLLGGKERDLANGTHLRGDINVMLVGDPSTAKSQLLRSMLDIAPLAISTTGRGSSGVGLTAAVTFDADTGDKRLEAGAMVLADRGIVCIDEFDKMSENDRVAIHEVMEQQTVTIAKAGIHASLNARCSVLAAANPVYGQYDKSKKPQENIGLPDSLLSRFDLLFIVLDQIDPVTDRRLSEHVIKSHLYRRPGTLMEPEPLNQASSINLEDSQDVLMDTPVWQRSVRTVNNNQHVNNSNISSIDSNDIMNKEFLRKYIHYAKNRINPDLSDDAMEAITHIYAAMRSRNTRKNLPITARTLETIIRLSTASAKARLSSSVEECDVDTANELMNFVLFHEVGTEYSVPIGNNQSNVELMDEINANINNENQFVSNNIDKSNSSKNNYNAQRKGSDNLSLKVTSMSDPVVVDVMFELKGILSKLASNGQDTILINELQAKMEGNISEMELTKMVLALERENKVMVIDDEVTIL
eukprot:gene6189-8524_t